MIECPLVSRAMYVHSLFFPAGGYDKCGFVWDLRQPHSPLERHEKGLGELFCT